jgi:EPS-associated MarR family transcriptional regulator
MTNCHPKLHDNSYFRVLRILHESLDVTKREFAEKLDVSVGGFNYYLKSLNGNGWVKLQNIQNSKNKFKFVYLFTSHGIAEKESLTNGFLDRKMQENEFLYQDV